MCFLWLFTSVILAVLGKWLQKPFMFIFSLSAFVSFILSLLVSNFLIPFSFFLILSFSILFFYLKRQSFLTPTTHLPKIDILLGKQGIVLETIPPCTYGVGKIKLDGEKWSAITLEEEPILKGHTVIIQEIRGLRLVVSSKKV